MKGAVDISASVYEIIALAARYFFTAIMLLIVARAWKITIVDSRRAASLRRLSPETGVCGEFLVVRGHGRAKDGMRYPVIREGLIGSSRKADIRLRSASVRRVHAFFELTPRGLRLRAQGGAQLFNARGNARRELLLGDGSRITIGQVELLLILTEAVGAPTEAQAEGLFDVPDDSPMLSPRPADRRTSPAEADVLPEPEVSPFQRPDVRQTPDAEVAFREVTAEESVVRRTVVREVRRDASAADNPPPPRTVDAPEPAASAPPPAAVEPPDDLFMFGASDARQPGAYVRNDGGNSENVVPWADDWRPRPQKRAVKKRPGDDDLFDV